MCAVTIFKWFMRFQRALSKGFHVLKQHAGAHVYGKINVQLSGDNSSVQF